MYITRTVLSVLIAVSLCAAQDVNIRGTVKNQAGTAIEGAVVLLEKYGFRDTTEVDGSFAITGTIVGINKIQSQPFPYKVSASIKNSLLCIKVTEKSAMEITTFNIQGKGISTIRKKVNPGAHSIVLPPAGPGVYFHRIKTGNTELVLKSNSIGNISFGTTSSIKEPFSMTLSKKVESYVKIDDIIKAIKSGYLNYHVKIKNSDTSGIEIKLLVCSDTVTDEDGNLYHAVKIGNQIWTVENLRTTKYNDGADITNVTDKTEWEGLSTGAYCYYDNDSASNAEKYGALYNWYAVNTGKLSPAGWHVPDTTEWNILEDYLIANGYNWDNSTSGNKIGKAMAEKTDWWISDVEGHVGNNMQSNNSSGFSALPGGYRDYNGFFDGGVSREYGVFWSATEGDGLNAYYYRLQAHTENLDREHFIKPCGYSVRLLRD